MKNKELLNQKLKSYAALTIAVIAAQPGNAQIIYTDVDPDQVINIGDMYEIDINNDADIDFKLIAIYSSGLFAMYCALSASNAVAGYVGSVAGTTFPFVSALNSTDEIGSDLNWFENVGTYPLLWASITFLGTYAPWDMLQINM
ncbi:MAG: hypothetical protein ACHQFW_03290 [Chitinophagales bacterium]